MKKEVKNVVENANEVKEVKPVNTVTGSEITALCSLISGKVKDLKVSNILQTVAELRTVETMQKILSAVLGNDWMALTDDELKKQYLAGVRKHAKYRTDSGVICAPHAISDTAFRFAPVDSAASLIRVFIRDFYEQVTSKGRSLIVDTGKYYENTADGYKLTEKSDAAIQDDAAKYAKRKLQDKKDKAETAARELLTSRGLFISDSKPITLDELKYSDIVNWCNKHGYKISKAGKKETETA